MDVLSLVLMVLIYPCMRQAPHALIVDKIRSGKDLGKKDKRYLEFLFLLHDPKVNRAIVNIRSDADINSHNTNIIFVWSM